MQDLFEAARAARANAYAPYSKFCVGAALRCVNGKIYAGCNVENAAYPEGQCAEAGAISAMVKDGGREVVEVLVLGAGVELCTPCGGCRQKLFEFSSRDTPVHVCGVDGLRATVSLGDLLPLGFGPGMLAGAGHE